MADSRATAVYRTSDGLVGGVCAGLAEHFDVDIIVPRIFAVLITLVTFGVGVIAYIILWIKLPERIAKPIADPLEVAPDYVGGRTGDPAGYVPDASHSILPLVARVAAAVCLAVLFLVVAAMVPPMMPGTQWWQFWPVAFLLLGVFMVIVPLRSDRESMWHMLGIVVTVLSATALPMSLDIVSWYTLPYAFQILWFLVVAAVFLLGFGIVRNSLGLMVGGAACLAAFCLLALLFLAIPGHVHQFILITPQGAFQVMAF